MPGLNKSRFVDLREDLEDEFTCGICLQILNQPMVVSCLVSCRQTYCDDCIRQWLANNSNCPNDRSALTVNGLYPVPNAMLNILNKFRIHCEYFTNGCPHVCALEHLANHMGNGCDYNPARLCTDCGAFKDENSAHNCIQTLNESIQELKSNEDLLKTEVESLGETVDTLLTKVSALEEKIRDLELNRNLNPGNDFNMR